MSLRLRLFVAAFAAVSLLPSRRGTPSAAAFFLGVSHQHCPRLDHEFVVVLKTCIDVSLHSSLLSSALPGGSSSFRLVPRSASAFHPTHSDVVVLAVSSADTASVCASLASVASSCASNLRYHRRRLHAFAEDAGTDGGVGARLGTGSVLARGFTGAGVRVAILDSGVSPGHPHLPNVIDSVDFTSDGSAVDRLGHGTFVSAVVGGSGDDCGGVAPDALLHVLRVFTTAQVSYTSWFLDALNYALYSGVDVLNLSVGGPDHSDTPFMDKVRELTAAGVLIVSAIGNDGPLFGTLNNPADMPCVLGVGGVTAAADEVARFSSRGMSTWELQGGHGRVKPDLVTLASKILASKLNSGCKTLSGTSFASPVAAGAAALMISAARKTGKPSNPGLLKQALMESSRRIPSGCVVEQGSGLMQVPEAVQLLLNSSPRLSVYPSSLDLTDCPYMWPYCSQPLYHSSQPLLVNLTLISSLSASSTFTAVYVRHHSPETQRLLRVSFEHTNELWPYSGWLAVRLSLSHPVAEAALLNASLHVEVTNDFATVSSEVTVPLVVPVIPTPERSKRVLWDQFHNLNYPLSYLPRDDLNLKEMLDWNGDHIHTNFRTLYNTLRDAGYFVEVLNTDLSCMDTALYGALLLVDPEEEFFDAEIAKIREDVLQHGLGVVVLADWYNLAKMEEVSFFDANTQSFWRPLTGGTNVPALNDLLRPFGLELSSAILEGTLKIGGRSVAFHSGSCLRQAPSEASLWFTRSLKAGAGLHVPRGEGVPILALLNAGNGRLAVFGDSSFADDASAIASQNGAWLVADFLQYVTTGALSAALEHELTQRDEPLVVEWLGEPPQREEFSDRRFEEFSRVVGRGFEPACVTSALLRWAPEPRRAVPDSVTGHVRRRLPPHMRSPPLRMLPSFAGVALVLVALVAIVQRRRARRRSSGRQPPPRAYWKVPGVVESMHRACERGDKQV